MLSRQLLYLVLYKKGFCFLSFKGTIYPDFFCLQLFLSFSMDGFCITLPVLRVGQTQAGSVLEARKSVTGLGAMLLVFVVWIGVMKIQHQIL